MADLDDIKELAQLSKAKELELSARYQRLFNTSDGQEVMADLNGNFLTNAVPENADHARYTGRKDVMIYIMHHIQQR